MKKMDLEPVNSQKTKNRASVGHMARSFAA
jgi:hypothetical protein